MIIGISHIVLGSSDVAADAAWLQTEKAYTQQFMELHLPTSPEKRMFMRSDSDHQAMAFLRPKCGISVELLSYGSTLRPAVPMWRYVAAEPLDIAPGAEGEAEQKAAAQEWATPSPGHRIRIAATDRFATDWHWDPEGKGNLICLEVPDLAASVRFFCAGLACRHGAQGQGWAICLKQSPLPQWSADFLLIERKDLAHQPGRSHGLEGAGCRMISFLSSDAEKDNAKLMQAGAEATSGVFTLTVNAKPLRLAIVQIPGGAYIELMQVAGK